jgi:hypothetical protein
VQANCLDCRAYLPAGAGKAESKGVLAALALLLK